MAIQNGFRILFTAVIYTTAISLASFVFLPDQTSLLFLVPIICVSLLFVNAVITNHVDELGYAIMAVWVTILVISVFSGISTRLLEIDSINSGGLLGIVIISMILVSVYSISSYYL